MRVTAPCEESGASDDRRRPVGIVDGGARARSAADIRDIRPVLGVWGGSAAGPSRALQIIEFFVEAVGVGDIDLAVAVGDGSQVVAVAVGNVSRAPAGGADDVPTRDLDGVHQGIHDVAASSAADARLDDSAQIVYGDEATSSAAVGNDIQNRFADCGGAAAGPSRALQITEFFVEAGGVGDNDLAMAVGVEDVILAAAVGGADVGLAVAVGGEVVVLAAPHGSPDNVPSMGTCVADEGIHGATTSCTADAPNADQTRFAQCCGKAAGPSRALQMVASVVVADAGGGVVLVVAVGVGDVVQAAVVAVGEWVLAMARGG